MKTWKIAAAGFFLVTALMGGCDGGGGSGSGDVALSGRVLNNHTSKDDADRAVAGAMVILVKAADIKADDSVSPVEDLAETNSPYPKTITDSNGYYKFTNEDFSDEYSPDEMYFPFVDPPAASVDLLPGGSASRAGLRPDEKSAAGQNIVLTDTNGPDSDYIGSTVCLICHPNKNSVKHTLHSVGIRKIGPDGTIVNDLMDMEDTSVYNLAANNKEMLDKFTDPATQYTFADDAARSFWLGKDENGLYFQLTSSSNPKFYVKLTYGGESGLWRGLFMTTVYAGDGTYAANHGAGEDDFAYYVMAPMQYNENPDAIFGEEFVTYNADQWDFAGTANKGFTADPELESFDLGCAGCHGATAIKTVNSGLETQRRVAVFPEDDNGYEINGNKGQINIGCEKCHGPGSNHLDAGGRGQGIIAPKKLPAGRLAMICGSCHIRGENYTGIGGGVALNENADGVYETFRPGLSPAEFFGTADETGRNVVPFESMEIDMLTRQGYLEPLNFETNEKASWRDSEFGAVVDHSKANMQHYADLVRTGKYRNSEEILTCISCHEAHGSSYRHMLTYNPVNNAACLDCHFGPDSMFANIDGEITDRLKDDRATPEDLAVIGEDVEAHIFEETGTQQMAPYDPEGTAMGRCTLCHMPETARSAAWRDALVSESGQPYRHGDISSHTFDVMKTQAVIDMASARGVSNTTPTGITDACGDCHVWAGLP